MATSLRPHVRLVCPVCGQNLSTLVRDVVDNAATWVLDATSDAHLEAHS